MLERERRAEELHQAQLVAITAAAITPAPLPVQPLGKTISEYLDEYVDHKMTPGRKGSWSKGTARQMVGIDDDGNIDKKKGKLAVFRTIFGDKPAAALSRYDMENYIKVAYSIPANFSNPDYEDKVEGITLDMILNDSPKLKSFDYEVREAGTVREDLKKIKTFLKSL